MSRCAWAAAASRAFSFARSPGDGGGSGSGFCLLRSCRSFFLLLLRRRPCRVGLLARGPAELLRRKKFGERGSAELLLPRRKKFGDFELLPRRKKLGDFDAPPLRLRKTGEVPIAAAAAAIAEIDRRTPFVGLMEDTGYARRSGGDSFTGGGGGLRHHGDVHDIWTERRGKMTAFCRKIQGVDERFG